MRFLVHNSSCRVIEGALAEFEELESALDFVSNLTPGQYAHIHISIVRGDFVWRVNAHDVLFMVRDTPEESA